MKPRSFSGAPQWWAVVNIDQRRSRVSPDRVPDLLEALAGLDTRLAAERTVGDEVQLLTASSHTLSRVLETAARSDDWRIGIGIGPVQEPLPQSVREARGPAFVLAREAITTAHPSATHFAMMASTEDVGGDDYAGRQATRHRASRVSEASAVAGLLLHLWGRRTQEGWDVVDQLRLNGTGRAAAEALHISASAVSQRLRTAGWQPGEQGRELLESMLAEVLTGGTEQ